MELNFSNVRKSKTNNCYFSRLFNERNIYVNYLN